MTGRTHVIAAGLIGIMVATKWDAHPAYVLVCAIGGLFPDTDSEHSILGRWIPLWKWFYPHRKNVLHSLQGALWISGLCAIGLNVIAAFFFLFGYISHLLLDTLNKKGVPWLWPKPTCYSLASIKVGSKGEWFALILIYFIMMCLYPLL
jgi:inner membrane protein